jgi:hypothetical protein
VQPSCLLATAGSLCGFLCKVASLFTPLCFWFHAQIHCKGWSALSIPERSQAPVRLMYRPPTSRDCPGSPEVPALCASSSLPHLHACTSSHAQKAQECPSETGTQVTERCSAKVKAEAEQGMGPAQKRLHRKWPSTLILQLLQQMLPAQLPLVCFALSKIVIQHFGEGIEVPSLPSSIPAVHTHQQSRAQPSREHASVNIQDSPHAFPLHAPSPDEAEQLEGSSGT